MNVRNEYFEKSFFI